MALIFTLFVSVLVMAMATSYLGMTISGQKAARAYTQEATALSLAQVGLDAVISAMGIPENWEPNIEFRTDIFTGNNITLPLQRHTFTNPDNGVVLSNSNNGLDLNQVEKKDDIILWFDDFISFEGNLKDVTTCYSAGPIDIPDGNGTIKQGYFLAAVRPESVNVIPVGSVNINTGGDTGGEGYIIGIVSLIFNDDGNNINDFAMTKVLNDKNFVSSRVIQARVSDKEVGGIYENVVSASFPNSKHASQGVFSTIPSWKEFTADAAFIDENAVFNNDLVIDGSDPTTGGGAPLEARDAVQKGESLGVDYYVRVNGQNGLLNEDLTPEEIQEIYRIDVSGILKVTTLDGTGINAKNLQHNQLPQFMENVSAQQSAVYLTMETGDLMDLDTSEVNKMGQDAQGNQHRNFNYQSNVEGTRTVETIWGQLHDGQNRDVNTLLMSGVDDVNQAAPGLYRQLFGDQTQADHGIFIFDGNDYRPDPMYANETMEVPTIRITISQNSQNQDTYNIQRIEYQWNEATGQWTEQPTRLAVLTQNDLRVRQDGQNIQTNAIYVAGANIQVQGKATQNISIISDVNSDVEADNAQGTGVFDARLNAPNVQNGDQYQFVDMEEVLVETTDSNGNTVFNPNGQVDLNTSISLSENANQHISQVDDFENVDGTFCFPTYDANDEPPTGNITVIGDLVQAEGSNPVIGLIASNRILLNDFNHTTNPNAAEVDNRDEAENAATDSRNAAIRAENGKLNADDGVLNLDAVIASEKFNMAFDFNNSSKNLRYVEGNTLFQENRAPGDGDPAGNAPLDQLAANHGNFGKLMTENLANALGFANDDHLIADDGDDGRLFFVNQYREMLPVQARRQIWNDAFMGAIRPGNPEANTMFYGNSILNFKGMIISRYADINADAGTRGSDGDRINQLGYVYQIMNRDSNLFSSCPPLFAMAKRRSTAGRIPIWRVLTYIDKGAVTSTND